MLLIFYSVLIINEEISNVNWHFVFVFLEYDSLAKIIEKHPERKVTQQ